MRIKEFKEILDGFSENLPMVFMSSGNTLDFYYQIKSSFKFEVVHVNDGEIEDAIFFIKEKDFEDYYDKIVNSLVLDLTDEEIEDRYENEDWTKVLLITLDE